MNGSALFRRILPQLLTLAAVLAMVAMVFPGFFEISIATGRLYGSPVDILNRGAPVALLAIGMTLVIATRGIDLSVGAVMAISGAVAAASITSGHSVFIAILLALGAGLLCGLWNGILVAILKIQPIVATLILMVAGRGIAQLITEGAILTFNDPALSAVGSGTLATVPIPILIWFGMALLATFIVRRSALGMLIEAVGINLRASVLAGLNTRILLISVYMVSGLCAAIAGVIVTADINGADANNAGLWLELDAILAVVIGGNSLLGGRFSIVASLIGAMVIQSVNTGILLSGFPPEFNLIIKAAIILVILVLQSPRIRDAVPSLRLLFRRHPQSKEATE
ncbi:ABC transporter permease [Qingshengfaniella alkalisoli]|uniref:ABC transporter permease n=1 Tax=Qingshengfaniella alkalisoli TaxID=2599296 RepID=A0A5B8J9G3_9RHOB|nr:ABC transporter permease [Qingshengfaniella alkalisoli]QDY70880.1 ABC transporter permease [Qingshengfaniella alkalisoli]